ncbi:hypothetical protein RF55_16900, partial [Lasius niger]
MSECFICKKALSDGKITVAQKRGVQTLHSFAIKRGDEEHARMLENVDNITVHVPCRKAYINERMAAAAIRRRSNCAVSTSGSSPSSPSSSQSSNHPPAFDFEKRCLFCAEVIDEVFIKQQKSLPVDRRRKICEVKNECQFTISELMSQIEGDYHPDSRTVKERLKQKYEDDIWIFEMNRRESVVCFRNTGHKLLAEDWYQNKNPNPEDEKLRVIREAAATIVEDVRSRVYDTKNFPPPDKLMENADDAVPETLRVLLSEMIEKKKKKRDDSKTWQRKCILIAHSIISAIRPRSFVSSILLGVGAFLYKKFASRNLINILFSLGFSACYSEICMFKAACVTRPPREPLPSAFSQFVFDSADFNRTFHVMGGIHCLTPFNAIKPDTAMEGTFSKKNYASIEDSGVIAIATYKTAKSQGLQTLKVADVMSACGNEQDIMPTPTDMVWLYGKWANIDNVPVWNGFMENVTANRPYEKSKIICLPFINGIPSNYDTIFTSLLKAACLGRSCGQETIFVTFDQPLYWKARDIVACANESELSNVIVRLGGFHLLMSYLGAI